MGKCIYFWRNNLHRKTKLLQRKCRSPCLRLRICCSLALALSLHPLESRRERKRRLDEAESNVCSVPRTCASGTTAAENVGRSTCISGLVLGKGACSSGCGGRVAGERSSASAQHACKSIALLLVAAAVDGRRFSLWSSSCAAHSSPASRQTRCSCHRQLCPVRPT